MPPKKSAEEKYHEDVIRPLARTIADGSRNPLTDKEYTTLIVDAPASFKISEQMQSILLKGAVKDTKDDEKGKSMVKMARRAVTSHFNWKTFECSRTTALLTRTDYRYQLEALSASQDIKDFVERLHQRGSIARPTIDLMGTLSQSSVNGISVLRGGANPLFTDAQMMKLGEDTLKILLTQFAVVDSFSEMGPITVTKGSTWEEVAAELSLWTMDERRDDVTAFTKFMTKDGIWNVEQNNVEEEQSPKKKARVEKEKAEPKQGELPWNPKSKTLLMTEGRCFHCDDKGHRSFECKNKKYRGAK